MYIILVREGMIIKRNEKKVAEILFIIVVIYNDKLNRPTRSSRTRYLTSMTLEHAGNTRVAPETPEQNSWCSSVRSGCPMITPKSLSDEQDRSKKQEEPTESTFVFNHRALNNTVICILTLKKRSLVV